MSKQVWVIDGRVNLTAACEKAGWHFATVRKSLIAAGLSRDDADAFATFTFEDQSTNTFAPEEDLTEAQCERLTRQAGWKFADPTEPPRVNEFSGPPFGRAPAWTPEVPKESGWYWMRPKTGPEDVQARYFNVQAGMWPEADGEDWDRAEHVEHWSVRLEPPASPKETA